MNNRHNRRTVKLEISIAQCVELVAMLDKQLHIMGLNDKGFKDLYNIYRLLKAQL